MKILYSPQRNDEKIEYAIKNEVITATIGEKTDTFDLSILIDGKLIIYDNLGNPQISTVLPVIPIVSAERVDNILSVVLLNFIVENATNAEKYPQWIEI